MDIVSTGTQGAKRNQGISMNEDNIDPDELARYLICADCIGENYLKAEVERDGDKSDCTYCGETGKTISMSDLADWVHAAFEDHFQRTSTEPTGYEYALLSDKEIDYDWERHGEQVAYVIAEAAQIDETPADHIQQILAERHFDIDEAKAGEENPYDNEAHYEEKGVEDYELRANWAFFQNSLKTETRLFNREAEAILDSIFEGLSEHTTHDSDSVIIDAGPDSKIAQIYRARVFQSGDKLENALIRPDREIGPPPFTAATIGRMNAEGISVFYGATDPGVALAEVRPPVGSRVIVARFDIVRPLRLLDVEALRSIYVDGSVFDPSYIRKLEKAKFLGRMSDQITMPVMPEDESTDYLVTQAIADYLASRTKPEIDGIIYRSIQNGSGGLNVALFNKSSRVEALDIPEGTDISAQLESWSDEGPEPNYWVSEEVPEKSEKNRDDDVFPFGLAIGSSYAQHDSDLRTPTLHLDVETVTVHHIDSIQVETTPFSVTRNRTTKRKPEF
jgi:RES domain